MTDIVRDLHSATARFVSLLDANPLPRASAVGGWSVADTAAHVRSVAALNALFATGAAPSPDLDDLHRLALDDRFSIHDSLTRLGVEWATARGFDRLRAGIVDDVDRIADVIADRGPHAPVEWLAGMKLSSGAIAAHLISELLVHGFDIARASARPFAVPDGEARHFFASFVPAMITAGQAAGFFDVPPPPTGPVSWRFHVRGGPTAGFVVADGALAIVEPDGRCFDLTVSARAGAMLLVMFRRVSPVGPALRGRISVHGRRPWRLGRMMKVLQTL